MTQFPIEQAIDFFQSRAVRVRIRGDMLDIALTALRQHQQGGGWLQIEGEMQGNFVVTNNINARDNTGKMSHIWYTPFIQESSEPRIYGKYICFDDADRKIHGLTHYYAIPAQRRRMMMRKLLCFLGFHKSRKIFMPIHYVDFPSLYVCDCDVCGKIHEVWK